jgi:outer membrane protein TolC
MISMLLMVGTLQGGAQPDTFAISLDAATRRALAVSPTVTAAQGAVRAPRGLNAEAWWPFPENPALEYGRIRRETVGSRSFDRDWSVTQEIEIAGQWAIRGRAAVALVRSAELRVDDARRVVGLEARRAYVTLAMAERRVLLTDSAAALAERLAQFARRQYEAGESNRLEVNAAVLDAARARSAAERAAANAAQSAADLSRLLGLRRHDPPHHQSTAVARPSMGVRHRTACTRRRPASRPARQ